MMKSELSDADKLATAYDFDYVLGLGFKNYFASEFTIPAEIQNILESRKGARDKKDWSTSDSLRDELKVRGFSVQDIDGEQKITQI